MGPKKGGKGAPSATEIDGALFNRTSLDYTVKEDMTAELSAFPSGSLFQRSTAFPSFNEEEGNIGTALEEEDAVIEYPMHISFSENKSVQEYVGLPVEPVDPKAKGKKDAKKGAAATEELTEPEEDENGNKLPRMFLDTSGSIHGPASTWKYLKKWTPEQADVRAHIETLKEEVTTAEAAVAQNTEDETLVRTVSEKQSALSAYMETTAVSVEEPAGMLCDPIMSTAFDLVMRFGPGVCRQKGTKICAVETFPEGVRVLWDNLYPKLPDGRPCYNPNGRYLVKLFLGGSWRMIAVNDAVPLDAEGYPALSASMNPLEIWPTVLSKAIYIAYNMCGYSKSVGNIFQEDEKEDVRTRKTATFTSFVMSVLTGWAPSCATYVPTLVSKKVAAMKDIIDTIVTGGAPCLKASDLPEADRLIVEGLKKDEKSKQEKKLAKQFAEEFRIRREKLEKIVSMIETREGKIQRLHQGITNIGKEVFVVVTSVDGQTVAKPVLAVYYPEGSHDDVSKIQLLVNWSVTPPSPDVEKDEVPSEAEQTAIVMEWESVGSLTMKHGHISSLDSLSQYSSSAEFDWKWAAKVEEVDPKAKKGKGKEAASDEPAVLEAKGYNSPHLLKITAKASPEGSTEEGAGEGEAAGEEKTEGEAGETIEEKNDATEVALPSDELSEISLCVIIEADLPKVTPTPSVEGEEGNEETKVLDEAPVLVDDVIVVLEELSLYTKDSLTHRIQLNRNADIPVTKTFIKLPPRRNKNSDPILYWVRVHTMSSVTVIFHCDLDVVVGPAEDIWKEMGYFAASFTGTSRPTPANVTQVLCDVSINPPDLDPENPNTEEECLYPCFHTSRPDVNKDISLLHVDAGKTDSDSDSVSTVFPGLGRKIWSPAVNTESHLVSRFFQSEGSDTAAFPWAIVILSKRRWSMDVKESESLKRYEGKYLPNRKLTVFNDVLNIAKNSFPLNAKLHIKPLESIPVEGEQGKEIVPESDTTKEAEELSQVVLIIRFFRKSDYKLIHSITGRGTLSIYGLGIDGFLEDGESVDAGDAPPAKGKKGEPAVDGVPVVMECTIDESKSVVPESWRSRKPYGYPIAEETKDGEEGEKIPRHNIPEVSPQFEWRMDVLSGNVTQMNHDFKKLQSALDIKNKWRETDDREEKAVTASEYFDEAKKLVCGDVPEEEIGTQTTEVVNKMASTFFNPVEGGAVLEKIVSSGAKVSANPRFILFNSLFLFLRSMILRFSVLLLLF